MRIDHWLKRVLGCITVLLLSLSLPLSAAEQIKLDIKAIGNIDDVTEVTVHLRTGAEETAASLWTDTLAVSPVNNYFQLTFGNADLVTTLAAQEASVYVHISNEADGTSIGVMELFASPLALKSEYAKAVPATGIQGTLDIAQLPGGLVKLESDGKLPVIDGSNLTNIFPTANNGQVLTYDDGQWIAGDVTSGGGSGAFTVSGTDATYTGGNVGIGAASPTRKLVVTDTLSTFNSDYPALLITNTNTSTTGPSSSSIGFRNIYGDWSIGTGNGWHGGVSASFLISKSDRLTSSSSSVPEFVINYRGYVGIGIKNPQYKLDVSGLARLSGSYTTSDVRWKRNIDSLVGSLDKITQLRGVSYFWKDQEFPDMKFDREEHLGFIAQEVEGVYPQLVSTDSSGYKSVNYSSLVAPIIEAIKELKTEKDAEKAQYMSEINDLKSQVQALLERIELLENQ